MGIEKAGELIVSRSANVMVGREFIDLNGHVNYLGIPILFERQRLGLLAARGISLESIQREHGLNCVMSEMNITYSGSVQEGDEVSIITEGFLRGRLKLAFHQMMRRGEQSIAESVVTNFFIDGSTGRLSRIPDRLIEILSIPEILLPENLRDLEGQETFPYSS